MKTLHLHIAASLGAAVCLAFLAAGLRERQQALALNRLIANPGMQAVAAEDPRITFARGLQRVRAGEVEAGRQALQLALQRSTGSLQNQARYDLGNLALRQALAMASADDNLPAMLELAKQQYRDTLLRAPDNFPARYNLERALWLAPEEGLAEPEKDQDNARNGKGPKNNEDSTDAKEQAATTMKNEGSSLP